MDNSNGKFIVIEFIQNYDEVYGERSLGVVDSVEEANDLVSKRRQAWANGFLAFTDYVTSYVDTQFHVPAEFLGEVCDVESWWRYLESYGLNTHFVTRHNIKDELKRLLLKGFEKRIPGYDPPPVDRCSYGYFVVPLVAQENIHG